MGNIYTVSLLLTSLLIFGLAVKTLTYRNERASRSLSGFLFGIGLWCVGDAFRIAAPNESAILFWNNVAYAGIVILPPTLLLFVLAYTGRDRWFQRRYIAGLISISVIVFLIIVTNPIHSLWLRSVSVAPGTSPPVLTENWGLLWYPWAIYSYSIILLVIYLMVRELITAHRSHIHRVQTALVVVGIGIGTAANILFLAGAVSFDPSPFASAIMGVCFGVAMFRYELLSVIPIARDTVVRNMNNGLLVVDADDNVVDTNEQLHQMFNEKLPTWRGKPLSTVFSRFPELLESIKYSRYNTHITLEIDDETRHYDINSNRMSDAFETPIGRVIVVTDITQQVNKQQRLDRFASIISHDLRNPLNVAAGHLDLAREQCDSKHLNKIEQSHERINSLIQDLLILAREESQIRGTETIEFDSIARRCWQNVPTADATLVVESTQRIEADRVRFEQLLENLYRNAIEHGGEDITVTVGTLNGGLYIEDNGPGIPEEKREEVFEPGYSTAQDGTGLGLSIVQQIVEAHDWNVRVACGSNGGARFEITGIDSIIT